MYTIGKTFEFSASHQLTHLPEGHKCKRDHGHNYKVTVTLVKETLNRDGFVTDFAKLDPFGDMIKETFDHRHMRDVMGQSQNQTSEVMAKWFYDWLRGRGYPVFCVRVSETDKTFAEYLDPEFVITDLRYS